MKYLSLIVLSLVTSHGYGQSILTPGEHAVDRQWIKAQEQHTIWYMLKDTARIAIGDIHTRTVTQEGRLVLVTQVRLNNVPEPWVDTSIAELRTLKPLYHASYNAQRDMILHFGTSVTGSYRDKRKQDTVTINDVTPAGYFDSNLYPQLLSWLPLQEGYKTRLKVYDYNPAASGLTEVRIEQVKSGTYTDARAGLRKVWIVTVSDKLGGGDNTSVYFFDQADRKLWQQEISAGERKMVMVAEE